MRKLVAALACRAEGSRLYGKPLQNLDIEGQVTILDHMIDLILTIPSIQATVLGISEGSANTPFIDIARRREMDHIVGNPKDVLQRLINCGHKAEGTDIFRVTTESPFFYFEAIDEAWQRHLEHENDVTAINGLPDGSYFEIYTLEALEISHRLGSDKHRSEYCSLYIREHIDDFKAEILTPPQNVRRPDLRFTVDYPEDLVLCRSVYEHLKHKAPRLPLTEIIEFIEKHVELKALVAPYVVTALPWQ